ncbi:hypothetical protein RZN05_02285 [Sphingomonas sp. HF-S4]|uniref:Uncharacterized protein n=1 Tax=Sphingomonas agrestis TaxID=3080540 RepID=A0ABU3Y3P0_9SPHN|nr:hypothetical protein [Sphingomonas sp. HF-S4]MDV3455797.1 hypothetical protein [Sphingomonas sp. HF-S4]
MYRIPQSTVLALAAETRSAIGATDRAIHAGTQLLTSLIEGAAATNLPISATQRLLTRAHAHSGKLLEGRQGLCDLIAAMTVVKHASDQRELAFGCPKGLPESNAPVMPDFFTGAGLASAPPTA